MSQPMVVQNILSKPHTTRKMPAEWLWQNHKIEGSWTRLVEPWTEVYVLVLGYNLKLVHCTHWYSFNLCRKLLTRTVATPFFKTSSHAQISEIPTFGAAIGRQDILMASESQVYSEAPMATKRAQTSSCPPPFQDRCHANLINTQYMIYVYYV